ncbi:MAG: excinuclease ABC subunit UvrC [Candidatus Nanopelagicales bacterium]
MRYDWKPRSGDISTQPGVYRFLNSSGEVMYVGKAKNLRNRLNSYFSTQSLHPRTEEMLSHSNSVEWLIVNSEVEALQLEHTWINEFKPPFNVRFRDDKSYPWICFSMKDEIPRIMVVRGKRRKDNLYFGPYPNAREARDLVENLLRVFPMRSCSDTTYLRASRTNRACILADVGKCSAPCIQKVDPTEHRKITNEFVSAIKGNFKEKKRELQLKMEESSRLHEFERAALYRDQIGYLENIYQPTSVVLNESDNFDIFAVYKDELEISIQVLSVRHGLIISEKQFTIENVEELNDAEIAERILPQYYGQASTDVSEILVSLDIEDSSALSEFLGAAISRIKLHKPERGRKREILDLAMVNAKSSLEMSRSVRANDLAKRTHALNELSSLLKLKSVPMRIECIDISHLAGTNTVGSLVVFVDGVPRKSEYRSYNLENTNDDLQSITNLLQRRLKRLVDGDAGWNQQPDLILVDGGVQQAETALSVMNNFELSIPIYSLAKRFETVYDADSKKEVIIPRTSEALFLLQRIRDEAHRFAITQQKKSRKKGIRSQLEDIPGLGPKRIKDLFAHFGSLKNMKAASVEELAIVPSFSFDLAMKVWVVLHATESTALNVTTGEVIEGA